MSDNGSDLVFEAYESKPPLSVAPGFYPATVKAIEMVTGKFGEQLRFTFALDESEEEAWAWCSAKLGTATKLWKWATFLGHPPTVGQPFKVQRLVAARCQLAVQEKLDADGFPRAFIADVVREKGPTARQAKQAAAEPGGCPTPDFCFCGQPVHTYTEGGTPLCEKHAGEVETVTV